MPLFISSSNDRLPAGPWARTWLMTALLVCSIIGGYEGFFRLHGFRPGLRDIPGSWALERLKLKSGNPEQVVLLGSSRIQLGIDLEVFARNFPGPKPIQLAIDHTAPNAILTNLAEDESFRGIVICAEEAGAIYAFNSRDRLDWDRRDLEYLRFYQKLSPADWMEQHLVMAVEKTFTLCLPELTPFNLLASLREGKLPDHPYVLTLADRSRRGYYWDLPDLNERRRQREEQFAKAAPVRVSPTELEASLDQVEDAVARIQARGGKVVFVEFPSSGIVRQAEDRDFPRSRFWDLWAGRTRAVMIHYQDYPELARFECPDYSHLDHRDAVPFTEALARVIRQKLEDQRALPNLR